MNTTANREDGVAKRARVLSAALLGFALAFGAMAVSEPAQAGSSWNHSWQTPRSHHQETMWVQDAYGRWHQVVVPPRRHARHGYHRHGHRWHRDHWHHHKGRHHHRRHRHGHHRRHHNNGFFVLFGS